MVYTTRMFYFYLFPGLGQLLEAGIQAVNYEWITESIINYKYVFLPYTFRDILLCFDYQN